jgi:hypothetical protein
VLNVKTGSVSMDIYLYVHKNAIAEGTRLQCDIMDCQLHWATTTLPPPCRTIVNINVHFYRFACCTRPGFFLLLLLLFIFELTRTFTGHGLVFLWYVVFLFC